MRGVLAVVPFVLSWLVIAPVAAAAGGQPAPLDAYFNSVVAPSGEGPRFVAVKDGTDSLLLRIDQDGGEVEDFLGVKGSFAVPGVALDGSTSGVSADGETLVLADLRNPLRRSRSRYAVIKVRPDGKMDVREVLEVDGRFAFDAISPDGGTLYLVEYPSPNPDEYIVRAYDVQRGEFATKPVLAPDEMRGSPLTRISSPDGRWAYTLYDGAGEPFIHGLDTVAEESVCIDLPQLEHQQKMRQVGLALEPDGGTLAVESPTGVLLATVDTETFAVSDPPDAEPAAEQSESGVSGVAVGALVAGVALIVGPLLGLRRRHRED